MAFWNSTKLPTLPNHQQLTATEQRDILSELKLAKNDIKSLQNNLKSAPGGTGLLNRNNRLSLGKMQQIIKQYDPKLAQQLKYGFEAYHNKVQKNLDEKMAKNLEYSRLEQNIKKTRTYDQKRERSNEYMKEHLEQEKLKGLDGPVERIDKYGKYHALKQGSTSAIRVKKDQTDNNINHQWADKKNQQTVSIDDIKEQVKNLPDLPI